MDALPRYMSDEGLRLWLIWGQTEEDRAGLREYREELDAMARGMARARRIEATDTHAEGPEDTARRERPRLRLVRRAA